jgi:hypothetical protein
MSLGNGALREKGVEHEGGDQPKVHEKYGNRILPFGA